MAHTCMRHSGFAGVIAAVRRQAQTLLCKLMASVCRNKGYCTYWDTTEGRLEVEVSVGMCRAQGASCMAKC